VLRLCISHSAIVFLTCDKPKSSLSFIVGADQSFVNNVDAPVRCSSEVMFLLFTLLFTRSVRSALVLLALVLGCRARGDTGKVHQVKFA